LLRDLLALLRCPACHGTNLALRDERTDEREVRGGLLVCGSCAARYAIQDGVVELLSGLGSEARQERQVRNARKTRDWAIERERPYIDDAPGSPWLWPSFASNVEQGLAQLALDGARVLDIGAATCWSTRMLCERGARAVALDISTGILRDGEAQFATGVFFDRVAATMEELPFVDAAFDVVFASATVHHSPRLQHTLAEIGRVLAPAGRAVLVNEPVLGLLRRPSQFGREERELGMSEHIYRLWDYTSAARAAGLQPQILFPAALDRWLRGEIPGADTRWMRLARHFPVFYQRRPWLARWFQRCSLLPGHILFGLTLALLAEKQKPEV